MTETQKRKKRLFHRQFARSISKYPACEHLNMALWYLLKKPEMRPLTLEEIIAELGNKELDVVWVECTVLMGAVPIFPSHRHGDTAFFFAPLTRQACTETLSNYGKTWRCWPRKPTPEQMAAEKWEE